MGTFGTGPFSSDGAMDFLEELAGRPAERRGSALARMFLLVKDKPAAIGWSCHVRPDPIREAVTSASSVMTSSVGAYLLDTRPQFGRPDVTRRVKR